MLTPIDIQQMEFPGALFGFNKKEVADYLETLSREFESLIKENSRCHEDIKSLSQRCEEYKNKEKFINDALVNVEKISADMKANAMKEAEVIKSSAELQADEMTLRSRESLTHIEAEIDYLKKEKSHFLHDMCFLIDRFSGMVEAETDTKLHSKESV